MAGCRSEYLPVVLAAVEAIAIRVRTRANASIGRAVRFVWANIGVARPGGIS